MAFDVRTIKNTQLMTCLTNRGLVSGISIDEASQMRTDLRAFANDTNFKAEFGDSPRKLFDLLNIRIGLPGSISSPFIDLFEGFDLISESLGKMREEWRGIEEKLASVNSDAVAAKKYLDPFKEMEAVEDLDSIIGEIPVRKGNFSDMAGQVVEIIRGVEQAIEKREKILDANVGISAPSGPSVISSKLPNEEKDLLYDYQEKFIIIAEQRRDISESWNRASQAVNDYEDLVRRPEAQVIGRFAALPGVKKAQDRIGEIEKKIEESLRQAREKARKMIQMAEDLHKQVSEQNQTAAAPAAPVAPPPYEEFHVSDASAQAGPEPAAVDQGEVTAPPVGIYPPREAAHAALPERPRAKIFTQETRRAITIPIAKPENLREKIDRIDPSQLRSVSIFIEATLIGKFGNEFLGLSESLMKVSDDEIRGRLIDEIGDRLARLADGGDEDARSMKISFTRPPQSAI